MRVAPIHRELNTDLPQHATCPRSDTADRSDNNGRPEASEKHLRASYADPTVLDFGYRARAARLALTTIAPAPPPRPITAGITTSSTPAGAPAPLAASSSPHS